jgi:purine/pyrimidine-nucleoside phosphorylase
MKYHAVPSLFFTGTYANDAKVKFRCRGVFKMPSFFHTGCAAAQHRNRLYQLPGSVLAHPVMKINPLQREKEPVMSEFKNITIVKKANIYFDGKVTSRTLVFPDGSKKTLGIMLPGEYEFNTAEKEIMEIFAGDLEVLLPGSTAWKTIREGETFEVPPQSKFNLKIKTLTDYCCSFIQ